MDVVILPYDVWKNYRFLSMKYGDSRIMNEDRYLIARQNENLLEISDTEYTVLGSDWKAEDVYSPYSRFYYIIDGEGELTYDGGKVIMKPNTLCFVPLGLKFSYSCAGFLEKIYFHVNVAARDRNDLFAGCKSIITLPDSDVQHLLTQYKKNDLISRLYVDAKLRMDIIKVFGYTGLESASEEPYNPLVTKAVKYINYNLSVKLSIGQISQKLYVSQSALEKSFRQATGVSIGRYIDDKIIFEAEKLLADKSISIEEISKSLGFCDRFYFSRRFKEKTGNTPREYRNMVLNTYL